MAATPTLIHGGTAPLAALTTVFSPPCPTSWLLTGTITPTQLPVFPRPSEGCDPPSWGRNLDGGGFQYYSPAICPRGFSVGPGCGLASTRTSEGFPAVVPGETVAFCVPTGMACTTDLTGFRGGVWGWAKSGTGAAAAVTVGPAIQIRWALSDLEVLETHPLTPGQRRQAVATGTAENPLTRAGSSDVPLMTSSAPGNPSNQTGAAPNEPEESNQGSWPLDRNATAFLIVVLVVLVSLIVGILCLVVIRRHKAGKLTGYPAIIMGRLIPNHPPNSHGKSSGKMIEDDDDIEGAQLGYTVEQPPCELEDGAPRGSVVNPAELDGWGVGQRPKRWSGVPQKPSRTLHRNPSVLSHRLSPVREVIEEEIEKRVKLTDAGRIVISQTPILRRPEPLKHSRTVPPATPSIVSPLSPEYSETKVRFGNDARAWSYWKNSDAANSRGVI